MTCDKYLQSIRDATRGEILGEELFLQLAAMYQGTRKQKLQQLADLERKTALLMRRVLRRHGIELQVEDPALKVRNLISEAGITNWQAFLGWMHDVTTPYVAIYEDLASNACPEDREVLLFLAKHERALWEFLEVEMRGESNAERHIHKVLGEDIISSLN